MSFTTPTPAQLWSPLWHWLGFREEEQPRAKRLQQRRSAMPAGLELLLRSEESAFTRVPRLIDTLPTEKEDLQEPALHLSATVANPYEKASHYHHPLVVWFKEADEDGDGLLSYADFIKARPAGTPLKTARAFYLNMAGSRKEKIDMARFCRFMSGAEEDAPSFAAHKHEDGSVSTLESLTFDENEPPVLCVTTNPS